MANTTCLLRGPAREKREKNELLQCLFLTVGGVKMCDGGSSASEV